jgi:hypothetical protein
MLIPAFVKIGPAVVCELLELEHKRQKLSAMPGRDWTEALVRIATYNMKSVNVRLPVLLRWLTGAQDLTGEVLHRRATHVQQ